MGREIRVALRGDLVTPYGGTIAYLLRRKLVPARAVARGDLTIWELSRRNRTVSVVCESGPSYVLKLGISPEGIATVAHEGRVYRWLHEHPDAGTMRRYLPRCYGYDTALHMLILELLPHSRTLREHQIRTGRCSRRIAAVVGQALASLHRLALGTAGGDVPEGSDARAPWPLHIHVPGLATLQSSSSANRQLIAAVQQRPDVCAALDELREAWRPEALVHHDLRWDNCLVVTPEEAPGRRRPQLRLIDWELAGLGDPCWDVASLFAEYLSFWALSIPATPDEALEPRLERARYPLESVQPAVRACWRSYARHMALDPAARARWLQRITMYTGARLIQTAYEHVQLEVQMTSRGALLLQLAVNILRRPEEALPHVLGLPTF